MLPCSNTDPYPAPHLSGFSSSDIAKLANSSWRAPPGARRSGKYGCLEGGRGAAPAPLLADAAAAGSPPLPPLLLGVRGCMKRMAGWLRETCRGGGSWSGSCKQQGKEWGEGVGWGAKQRREGLGWDGRQGGLAVGLPEGWQRMVRAGVGTQVHAVEVGIDGTDYLNDTAVR